MSILTWRDVTQPDFSAAIQGTRAASDAMNNAFNNLSGTLGAAREVEANAADRAIQNRILGIQDPEALKAALANGSLVGADGNLAHLPFLKDVNNQVGTMIENSLKQAQTGEIDASTNLIGSQMAGLNQALEQAKYNFGRTVGSNIRTDAMGPVLATHLADIKNPEDYNNALTKMMATPEFKALNPAEQAAFTAQFNMDAPSRVATGNNILSGNLTAQNAIREQLVKNAYGKVMQAGNTEQARTIADAAGLDPQGRQALDDMVAQSNRFQDWRPSTPIPSLAGLNVPMVGFSGNNPNLDFAAYNGMSIVGADGKPQAWSDTTLGDALAHGNKMIEATKGKVGQGPDKGTSAQTPLMFTNETLKQYAPTALGANWMNEKLTPTNQAKIAAAVLKDRNDPTALKKTWVALTDNDVKTIAANNYDPNVAIPLIISRENGMSLNSVLDALTKTQETNQTINTALAQAGSKPGVKDYSTFASLQGDNREVAAQILADPKSFPEFQGMPLAQLEDYIKQSQDVLKSKKGYGNGNAGLAALAVKMSMINGNTPGAKIGNVLHNLAPWTNYHQETYSSGYRIDPSALTGNIDTITKPDMADISKNYEKQKATASMVQGTQQDYADRLAKARIAAYNYSLHPDNVGYQEAFAEAARQVRASGLTMADFSNDKVNGILKPVFNTPNVPQGRDASSIIQTAAQQPPVTISVGKPKPATLEDLRAAQRTRRQTENRTIGN